MTYVCLVRHGETEWNVQRRIQGTTETELTLKGYNQAYEIALFLKKKQWDHIITSPLKRAVQTAEIIAEELKISDIKVWPEFQEREYGQATGMYLDEYTKCLENQLEIKDWENDALLGNRVLKGLEKILQLYSKKRIIVISHGVPIMGIMEYIMKKPFKEDIFYLKNGSVSSIYYESQKWNIEHFNLTNFLIYKSKHHLNEST